MTTQVINMLLQKGKTAWRNRSLLARPDKVKWQAAKSRGFEATFFQEKQQERVLSIKLNVQFPNFNCLSKIIETAKELVSITLTQNTSIFQIGEGGFNVLLYQTTNHSFVSNNF
jgi:hypothetical protein